MWNNDLLSQPQYDFEEVPDDFKIPIPSFHDEEIKLTPQPTSIFDKYIPKNDWESFFKEQIKQPYFQEIEKKYTDSINKHFTFPKKTNLFRAFNLSPINSIKVVILGQDPYPGNCKKTLTPYANGLAFSVNKECSIPASLKNMYKELENCGYKRPNTGELEPWARQGVFLINTQLSVEKGNANSHKFWNKFTDNVIKHIGSKNKKIVFVLMGRNALNKFKLIPKNKNTKRVITSHPSPLGVTKNLGSYPAFRGSKIFLEINKKLGELNLEKIKW